MRKIRSIARLAYAQGLSVRAVARSLSVSRDAVQSTLDRLAMAELAYWPLPDELDDETLEAKLYPVTTTPKFSRRLEALDCPAIEQRMAQQKWDLRNAHRDYRERTGSTISYSYFAELMRKHHQQQSISMRQNRHAGDLVEVDFSGTKGTVHPVGLETPVEVEIFVGVLGYSSYIYAEAVPSQKIRHWLMAHARMFEFFGGVPKAIVCDNLKSAVKKPSRHSPVVTDSYEDLAEHYDTVILPARVRKPKDKSKAEGGVNIVRQSILMRLQTKEFRSIDELNAEIWRLLEEINAEPFQKTPGSRLSRFLECDKPALKALPAEPYEYKQFHTAQVNNQYHVEVNGCYYSVPYQYANRKVDLILSERTVTVLHKGRRIAVHAIPLTGDHVTDTTHMPSAHQFIAMWTPESALAWADTVGPSVRAYLEVSMAAQKHPVQQRRTATGMSSLCKKYGSATVENASRRALELGATGLHRLTNLLETGVWKIGTEEQHEASFDHENVRGPKNYE